MKSLTGGEEPLKCGYLNGVYALDNAHTGICMGL